MTYKEGDWVIENVYGLTGTIVKVYPQGVSARFGNFTAIRHYTDIEPAPLDLKAEDIRDMVELALMTNDKSWFQELMGRVEEWKKNITHF